MEFYEKIAKEARLKILDLIHVAQTSHIGSNFSVIDIMAMLFENINLEKDKIILSKGWAAASLYYFLWRKNRITEDELNSYCMPGSKFIGLAEPIMPDIPAAGGALGYGFPMGVGFALAKKLKKEDGTIFVIMSDGEMDVGTTWESALIAAHHGLNNLVIIVDYNGFQAMGKKNEILNIEPLKEKWEAFGWDWCYMNGHIFDTEKSILNRKNLNWWIKKSPIMPHIIIANTIKGKGVSFMQNNNDWHYLYIDDESYERAKKELGQS